MHNEYPRTLRVALATAGRRAAHRGETSINSTQPGWTAARPPEAPGLLSISACQPVVSFKGRIPANDNSQEDTAEQNVQTHAA